MKACKFGAVSLTDPQRKSELAHQALVLSYKYGILGGTANWKGDLALNNKNYHQGE